MESQSPDLFIAIGDEARASEPVKPAQRQRLGLLPTVAILGSVLGGIALGLWLYLADGAAPATTPPSVEDERQVAELLRTAKWRYSMGRLTQPVTDSALTYSLKILQITPDSTEANEVISIVGGRYLDLIAILLEEQNLPLARSTLEAAERLQSLVPRPSFIKELAEAKAQLQALEKIQQSRRAAVNASTGLKYKPLQVFQDKLATGGQAPRMIFIAGGALLMGSPMSETGRDQDEGPQVQVSLQPFAIGESEVTFAEYDRFVAATGRPAPAANGWGRGDRPVINISWADARSYAIWLSRETGFRYRLPTEAEWEFAARAGTTTPFSSGECLSTSQANFDDRKSVAFNHCPSSGFFVGQTVPVTAYPPNPWGLHGVHGNVRELLQDCWVLTYSGRPQDGSAVFSGEGGQCGTGGSRIARGGVWDDVMKSGRSANRFAVEEQTLASNVGLRLARDVDY